MDKETKKKLKIAGGIGLLGLTGFAGYRLGVKDVFLRDELKVFVPKGAKEVFLGLFRAGQKSGNVLAYGLTPDAATRTANNILDAVKFIEGGL